MIRDRCARKRDKPGMDIPPALQRQHDVPGLGTSVEHFYIIELLCILDFDCGILFDHIPDTIHTNRIPTFAYQQRLAIKVIYGETFFLRQRMLP